MPLSQFSAGLKNTLMLLPGTYGTSLLRNHALRGVYAEMSKQGLPTEVVDAIKTTADCNLEFFGHGVEIWQMYLVLVGAIVLLVGGYILLHSLRGKGKNVKKV